MAKTENLTWNAPAAGQVPDSYNIYRKDVALTGTEDDDGFGSGGVTSGAIEFVKNVAHTGVAGDAQAGQDTTAPDGTTIFYCVTALKGTLESDQASSSDGGKAFEITTAA